MSLDPVEIVPDIPQLKIKTPAERLHEGDEGNAQPETKPAKSKKSKPPSKAKADKNPSLKSAKLSFRWKMVAMVLALGFGIGGYFVGGKLARSSPKPVVEEAPPPQTTRSLDELIQESDWATALKIARFRYKTGSTSDRPALQYREALALEFSGDPQGASELYAKLTESTGIESGPSRMGLARCRLAENRLEEARTLLAGMVLLGESQNIKANNLGAEAAYFQVRLAMTNLTIAPNPSPWDIDGLAKASRTNEISRFLSWVPLKEPKKTHGHGDSHGSNPHDEHAKQDEHPKDEHPKQDDQAKDAHPKKDDHAKKEEHPKQEDHAKKEEHGHDEKHDSPTPNSPTRVWTLKPHATVASRSLLTAKAPSLSVNEVLESVRHDLHIPVTVEPEVIEKISGKQYPVDIKTITLGDFLAIMLEPLGCKVVWTDRTCTIKLGSTENEDRYATIKKLIQRALVIGSDHPEKFVCLVDLGNLEAGLKNYKEAMMTYSKLLRDAALSQEALPAAYNLGLMQLHFGDRKGARETFQNVADRDLKGTWAALAHYWAGRSALESDDLELALGSFQRAVKASPESDAGAAAALGSAHVYMLTDRPTEARSVLRPYKKTLGVERTKNAVALIDSYARFKLAKRPKSTGETEDLTYAVLSGADSSPLGPSGVLLMGYAAREIGLDIKLTQLFDHASEQLSGPLGVRLTAESGEQYFVQGDWDKALTRYRAVAAADQGKYGIQARLRLVDLCLKRSKKDEALQFAREALLLPGCDRSAGLKALGKSYEAKGDSVRATLCFSGQIPN